MRTKARRRRLTVVVVAFIVAAASGVIVFVNPRLTHYVESDAFRDFSIPGRSLSAASGLATAVYRVVTPGYFTTIETPLREGRVFEETDGPGNPGVALVNDSFARIWFPGEDAVGKRIQLHHMYAEKLFVHLH